MGHFLSFLEGKDTLEQGQILNILGFVNHMVSVVKTQLWPWRAKTALDNV